MVTDSSATRAISSRSLAETGGSAVSTNTAASMVPRAASASAVLWAWTEPVPGVSTSSAPRASTGASATTLTDARLRRLPGFPRSVTRSPSADSGKLSARPSRKTTLIPSSRPYRTVVARAVSGVTPTGSKGRPRSALTRVLLPRLASPATRTRSRCSRSPPRSSSSAAPSSGVPRAASSSRAARRGLLPSSRARALLPSQVGTIGGRPRFTAVSLRRPRSLPSPAQIAVRARRPPQWWLAMKLAQTAGLPR